MAKLILDRVRWKFRDGYDNVVTLNDQFFPWMVLLERLMREVYVGKKVTFLNISFTSEETYRLYPAAKRYYAYYYDGVLSYSDVFDFDTFYKMPEAERLTYIWNRLHDILKILVTETKNPPLLEAAEYAWRKGLETGLNPDYRLLQTEVELHGKTLLAALWIQFSEGRMTAVFKLEKGKQILLEKYVYETVLGNEFFLVAFKKIETNGNTIIIKGAKDIDELPMKIPISADIIGAID